MGTLIRRIFADDQMIQILLYTHLAFIFSAFKRQQIKYENIINEINTTLTLTKELHA